MTIWALFFVTQPPLLVNGIIIDKTSCDPLYRKSIRVSAGAVLKVPYTQGANINEIIAALNDADFHLYARYTLKQTKITKRIALILGTDGDGLSIHILKRSETARIPTVHGFDNLNIVTKSGIIFAHFSDFDKLFLKRTTL
ncbi:hypothetical protein O9A_01308 [Bartonella koehlerae C-29]|uniref:tRNA/rRNA methyltransferase SpoU type domain-containing protein n=1 Tax=Bartonella koehlerae C-29 TaxID=1134510 RepID=A0A067W4N7_9HYPH|nr:hypothetical protein O9A_01308 [Bartonella koehlerae C-29]